MAFIDGSDEPVVPITIFFKLGSTQKYFSLKVTLYVDAVSLNNKLEV